VDAYLYNPNFKQKHGGKLGRRVSSFLGLAFFSLVSCTQGFRVDERVERSIRANQTAKTYAEWEASEDHPQAVFASLRQESQDLEEASGKLCKKLESLEDMVLTVFEVQIFSPESTDVLAGCQEKLQERLKNYYEKSYRELAQNLQVKDDTHDAQAQSQSRIKFRTLEKDLSQGAYLTHAGLPHKHVVLTFDDGPHASFTPVVLQALEDYGVRGTFFVVGNNVSRYPGLLRRMGEGGHSIGNHSMTHPCMGSVGSCKGKSVSQERAQRELIQAHQLIFRTLGWVDPFVRFPYGAHTNELRAWVQSHHTAIFSWNVDSLDWKSGQSEWEVFERTIKQLKNAGERGILLFHDIHLRTTRMLPYLLEYLSREGYTVVSLRAEQKDLLNSHPFLQQPIKP